MTIPKGELWMEFGARKVTNQEIELIQDIFILGVKVCEYDNHNGRTWIDFQKNEILSKVRSDVALSSLLRDIFQCGNSVGERRKEGKISET